MMQRQHPQRPPEELKGDPAREFKAKLLQMRSADSKMIEEMTDFASRHHNKHGKDISNVLFDVILKVRLDFWDSIH